MSSLVDQEQATTQVTRSEMDTERFVTPHLCSAGAEQTSRKNPLNAECLKEERIKASGFTTAF